MSREIFFSLLHVACHLPTLMQARFRWTLGSGRVLSCMRVLTGRRQPPRNEFYPRSPLASRIFTCTFDDAVVVSYAMAQNAPDSVPGLPMPPQPPLATSLRATASPGGFAAPAKPNHACSLPRNAVRCQHMHRWMLRSGGERVHHQFSCRSVRPQHQALFSFSSPRRIFAARCGDLDTAKNFSSDSRFKGFVVRCRGLSYSASAQDILKFFEGIEVAKGQEGIVFTFLPDGRPSGEHLVFWRRVQLLQRCCDALQKHFLACTAPSSHPPQSLPAATQAVVLCCTILIPIVSTS